MPDAPAPEAMGNIFQDYNPQGALGGLFAPAYIQGFAPSEQAVQAWTNQNHAMNPAMLEQTRMPGEWRDPTVGASQGGGPYGAGRIPDNLNFGDARGAVDPEALRIMAQGGQYDMGARRNAIAARMASNTQAQQGYNDLSKPTDPWKMLRGVNGDPP